MRAERSASSTVAWGALALVALGCAASRPPAAPPPRDPPARVLIVKLPRIALRESAFVELHAALAASARGAASSATATATASAPASGHTLAEDEADLALRRTVAALARCVDDACAARALAGTALAAPFEAALGPFVARDWTALATSSRAGVEAARAAFGAEAEALLVRVARDLAIAWPAEPPIVAVVTTPVPPGPKAPIPAVLAARGSCFARGRAPKAPERVHDARIIDCLMTYALLDLADQSALHAELARALPPEAAARAWTLLVVHAVAVTVTAWEPRHASVLRRSAEVVEPAALGWLAEHWRARASGEGAASFAARYAAEMR